MHTHTHIYIFSLSQSQYFWSSVWSTRPYMTVFRFMDRLVTWPARSTGHVANHQPSASLVTADALLENRRSYCIETSNLIFEWAKEPCNENLDVWNKRQRLSRFFFTTGSLTAKWSDSFLCWTVGTNDFPCCKPRSSSGSSRTEAMQSRQCIKIWQKGKISRKGELDGEFRSPTYC